METRSEIFRELKRSEIYYHTNYYETADRLEEQGYQYERKIVYTPLLGSASGIALIINGLARSNFDTEFVAFFLPSAWLFFLGLILSFFVIWAFTKKIVHMYWLNMEKGESQVLFNKLKLSLNDRNVQISSYSKSLSQQDFEKISSIEKVEIKSRKSENRVHFYAMIYRLSFALSLLCILFAILVPLFSVSIE